MLSDNHVIKTFDKNVLQEIIKERIKEIKQLDQLSCANTYCFDFALSSIEQLDTTQLEKIILKLEAYSKHLEDNNIAGTGKIKSILKILDGLVQDSQKWK